MDVSRPRSRRKVSTQHKRLCCDGPPKQGSSATKRHKGHSEGPQVQTRHSNARTNSVESTTVDATPSTSKQNVVADFDEDVQVGQSILDESMVTSTRRPDDQFASVAAMHDMRDLSPILPYSQQVRSPRLKGVAHKKPLFISSSPNVPKVLANEIPRPVAAGIQLFSGDEDLFDWDLDEPQEVKEKADVELVRQQSNDGKVSGQIQKYDQGSEYQTNFGQNHERMAANNPKDVDIHPAIETHQPDPEESCDLWDGDDTFYAQIDLSRIVAESQKNNQGSCPKNDGCDVLETGTKCPKSVPRDNAISSEAIIMPSHQQFTNKAISTTNENRGLESGAVEGRLVKSSVAQNAVEVQFKSVQPVQSNCPDDAGVHEIDQHGDHEVLKTPHQEKWFSKIKEESGNLVVAKNICSNEVTSKTHANSDERTSNRNQISPAIAKGEASSLPKTLQMTTPVRQISDGAGTSAGSLLKRRLQSNKKVVTTPTFTRAQKLQEAAVHEALAEMANLGAASSEKDIGPFYGLPSKVQELLAKHRGISQLYDWQHECLRQPAVTEGRNLIYSLPTSGGKTLVAEILIMQQLLCHAKDAILILPFVSIVQEKVTALSPMALELGFLVEEYASTKGSVPPRKRMKKRALYVCTIEKAHTIVNSLIQEGRIGEIGLAVVDELHMVGDGGRRGASLEICISKLLHLRTCQIVGMSATLSNIQDLSSFLKAEVYTNNFRPVDLVENIKLEDNIYQVNPGSNLPEDEKFTHSRTVAFPYNKAMLKNDPDHLVGLALEVIPTHSCLVFCATKKNCQNVVQNICKYIPRNLAKQLFVHKQEEKQELLAALLREGDNKVCPTLKRTIPFGAGYHHGGLTVGERKLVEEAYSDGTLCLLTATSTLAAGVNLPAKRVILRSPYIATELLTRTRYKQMVGRAGRAGRDTTGESILIVKPKERQLISEMLNGPVEGCYSSLMYDGGKGMKSLVLSLISLKMTLSADSLCSFIANTLCGIQAGEFHRDLLDLSQDALHQVIERKLVKQSDRSQALEVTQLGHAAVKGSIDIDLCDMLYDDLKTACDHGLVLANSLHLLYLVTPYDQIDSIHPNWMIYMRQFSRLDDAEHKAADLVGVTEYYMQCKMSGFSKTFTPEIERRARRFYLTLILWDILGCKDIWTVAANFEVPRGFVQSLFNSAASFAFSVQRFCEDLPEFWAVYQLLSKLVSDLSYCATADLLPLLEITGVKQGRAKQLVKAGYKTLRHLAHADPAELVTNIQHLPKKMALQIVSAAKLALQEKVEALKEEADELNTRPEEAVT